MVAPRLDQAPFAHDRSAFHRLVEGRLDPLSLLAECRATALREPGANSRCDTDDSGWDGIEPYDMSLVAIGDMPGNVNELTYAALVIEVHENGLVAHRNLSASVLPYLLTIACMPMDAVDDRQFATRTWLGPSTGPSAGRSPSAGLDPGQPLTGRVVRVIHFDYTA
jgi:hypothetical protein